MTKRRNQKPRPSFCWQMSSGIQQAQPATATATNHIYLQAIKRKNFNNNNNNRRSAMKTIISKDKTTKNSISLANDLSI